MSRRKTRKSEETAFLQFLKGTRYASVPGKIFFPTHQGQRSEIGARRVFLFDPVPRVPRKSHAIFGGPGGQG